MLDHLGYPMAIMLIAEGPQKHAAAPSAISAQPVASSNSIPQAAQNPDAGKPATCVPEQQPGRQAMNGHAGPSGQTADEEGMHEAEDLDQGGSPAAGPLNGCLSLSCGGLHNFTTAYAICADRHAYLP